MASSKCWGVLWFVFILFLFYFNFFKFFYFYFLPVCMWVHRMHAWYPGRLEDNVRPLKL